MMIVRVRLKKRGYNNNTGVLIGEYQLIRVD